MRVLAVDDDPLILKALNRTFCVRWPEWEIVAVTSGELAVGWLTRSTFDLVLTDMQMPGMDGSLVLKMARELQPSAIRVVLSGHAPLLRIMEAQGDYHRFLTKPIDPNELMTILGAYCLEGKDEGTKKARAFVAGLDGLPCLPRNLVRLRTLLEDPSQSKVEIHKEIARDIGMAAKLLKLVNSAYLTFGRSITDLKQAVKYLGADVIRELVMNRAVLASAVDVTPEGLDLEVLWAHSRKVGLKASALVLKETGSESAAAEAYSIGLLHDVGMVVLANTPASGYRSILEEAVRTGASLPELERARYGTDHVQIGAQILSLWGLPESFSTVILEHHARHLADHTSLTSLALHVAQAPMGNGDLRSAYNEAQFIEGVDSADSASVDALWERILVPWKQHREAIGKA